jgi:hypothetical protein
VTSTRSHPQAHYATPTVGVLLIPGLYEGVQMSHVDDGPAAGQWGRQRQQ